MRGGSRWECDGYGDSRFPIYPKRHEMMSFIDWNERAGEGSIMNIMNQAAKAS